MIRITTAVLALALLAAGAVSTASADGAATAHVSPIPTRAERDRIFGLDEHPKRRLPDPRQSVRSAAQDQFDVTHYLIALSFDDVARTVSGNVTVTATSLVTGLQLVELDLRNNMTVSQVTIGLTPLAFVHQNHVLTVTLPAPVGARGSFSFTVNYSGSPQAAGFGTFGWNKFSNGGGLGQMVWSLSEPNGARYWWPCKDRPDDKALVEEWWTVRGDWTATGNGVLLGVDTVSGNRKRYRWRATHPLTTYLVSVAATNYASFSHSYTPLAGGSMPIDYYVYPEDLAAAQVSFSATASILGIFAQMFGEYPFVEDKYGMSAFPFGGAMEHSTNTSYGYELITGTNFYDWVNAHEIAHQWWGDSVSPETWADIWLNEGFASYSEALWSEHLGGPSALENYMQGFWDDNFGGPVYDPNNLFGSTVYNKGAWVLHMLRGVMGDTAFFESLSQWYETKTDGVGNTAQFRANQEDLHGGDLGWFFDEWVYGTGQPAYEFGYTTANRGDGTYRTYVRIRQVQSGGGTFTMPVDLTLATAAGNTVHTVWNDAAEQDFALDGTAPLLILRFDEDDWILKSEVDTIVLADADADGVPDHADNCAAVSNAAQQDTDDDALGDACDADDDGDTLLDTADCAPGDPEQGLPGEVLFLHTDGDTLGWTAAPRADSYDVSRGSTSALASGYGACLISGVNELFHVDPDLPPAGDGFQYLVRGVDAGCGGAGSSGNDSAGTPRPSPCP